MQVPGCAQIARGVELPRWRAHSEKPLARALPSVSCRTRSLGSVDSGVCVLRETTGRESRWKSESTN